jgi:hypothetical protein
LVIRNYGDYTGSCITHHISPRWKRRTASEMLDTNSNFSYLIKWEYFATYSDNEINLHIWYELPFIFQVKRWQSDFYRHTNTEIAICLYKIYNHLADVISVCRSPWNGVPIRHRNYPRRCKLLNTVLKYSFTVFILQKTKVLDK